MSKHLIVKNYFTEAFKLFGKAKDGYLEITVPQNFENKNLGITITIAGEGEEVKMVAHLAEAEKRGIALSARFGKAKFKDYKIKQEDVYNQ